MNNSKTDRPKIKTKFNSKTIPFRNAVSKITLPEWKTTNPAQKEIVKTVLAWGTDNR